MKVYIIQNQRGEFASVNFAVAADGFGKMGWEVVPFARSNSPLLPELTPEDVVVGFIEDVNIALRQLGIASPESITYPAELETFLGRKIWRSTINHFAAHPEEWGVFIKPAQLAKKFTGRVVNSTKDLIGCGDELANTEIWCSTAVKFLAEWRVFVRYGEILGVNSYSGDWRVHFDPQVIERAVAAYTSAPAGYAADFGVTVDGRTLLIEVNDGYSLGAYGLFPADYARLLASRWAQLTGTRDLSIY